MLAIRVCKPVKSFASPMHKIAKQSSKRSPWPICTIYARDVTDLVIFVRLFKLLIAWSRRADFSFLVRTVFGRLQIQTANLKTVNSCWSSSRQASEPSFLDPSLWDKWYCFNLPDYLIVPFGPEVGTDKLLCTPSGSRSSIISSLSVPELPWLFGYAASVVLFGEVLYFCAAFTVFVFFKAAF